MGIKLFSIILVFEAVNTPETRVGPGGRDLYWREGKKTKTSLIFVLVGAKQGGILKISGLGTTKVGEKQ